MISLGQVAETIMGQAPPSSDCNKNGRGTPFVKAGEFGASHPVIREWTTKPLKLAKKDDVLLCVVGATSGKVNRGADCAIGRSVAAIRADESSLDHNYLYYFISSWSERLRKMSQGAAQTVITKGMIHDLKIPIPPISTQRKIVNILDAADLYRKKTKILVEKYDELAQSLFLDTFGDPVKNEKGWEKRQLSSLVTTDRPITYGILKPGEYFPNGIPMLRIQDIKGNIVSLDSIHYVNPNLSMQYKRTILSGNEIVISLVGTIGLTAIIPNELNGANVHRNLGVINLNSNLMLTKYFFYLTTIAAFKHMIKSKIKGGNQSLLNLGALNELCICTPNLQLQKQFVRKVELIENQKSKAKDTFFKANELYQSLIQKAFKGELIK